MLSPVSFIAGLLVGFALAFACICILVWAVAHMPDDDRFDPFDNDNNF
jgi:hypothetical protein